MELDTIKRVSYWIGYFIFMFILVVFLTASRLSLSFKIILIVLLAALSSMFRFEERFSMLSIMTAISAGMLTGAVLAGSMAQFWLFSVAYVVLFFICSEFFEKNILGV